MSKLNIFLDLEETVIDDWYSCNFLDHKIDTINDKIKSLSIDFLSEIAQDRNINLILFSAAVCNENDLNIFNKQIKPILEKKLEFKFSSEFLFSDENWIKLANKNGIKVLQDDNMQDIFNLNIKEQIFELIAIKNEVNILFDDTVDNKITQLFDTMEFNKKPLTTLIFINMK